MANEPTPAECSERYGRLLEAAHTSGYSFERLCDQMMWLLDSDRWKSVGHNYGDVNAFIRSIDLSAFKIESRRDLVNRIKELQPGASTGAIAAAVGVSRETVRRDITTATNVAQEEKPTLKTKGLDLGAATNVAPVKDVEMSGREAAAAARKAEQAPIIREQKREEIKQRLDEVAAREAIEPTGLYDVIVIDPPWQMEKIERDVTPNQVAFEYPTMTEDELRDMDIPCADDCHVWLWTTQKFLPLAFELLRDWGLKYVCTFVWHKPGGFQPYGLPQFNCEFALYARRGSPVFLDTKAFPLCFTAPRGMHSEKPEDFYSILRRVTAGRRLDMFNRRDIEGFDGYGKEAAGG